MEETQNNSKIYKAVICDDHSISQLGIQCVLQDYLGHNEPKLWTALTGQEALRLVQEHKPDLLTLDLHLPDMSGLEVLKKIRELGLNTKVMILTNEESLQMLLQLLRHNANAILLKSYTLDIFEKALKHVEEDKSGRTYLDASLEKRLGVELGKKQLSTREFEVLQLLIKGYTNKAIADLLACSPETVKTHRARIMDKTEARNRAEMMEWFQRGMVS